MSEKIAAGRNANLERVRLVSMLLIVSYHYCIWGFLDEEMLFSRNKFLVDTIMLYGWVGLLLFVLISGYFMVEGRFTLKKLLTMMGMIWFYSIGALLVFLFVDRTQITGRIVLNAFFPLLRQHYWFMTFYTALMLCSPFLNRLVHMLDRRQHALLCALALLLCVGIPKIADALAGTTLVTFIALYLCAAYVRLHMSKDKRVGNRCLLLAGLLILACVAVFVRREIVWHRIGYVDGLLQITAFMSGSNNPLVVLTSLLLLCGFTCRPASAGGPIARLGALTVGVYLFQSNDLISENLWQGVLHTRAFTDSPLMPLHAAGSLLLVFAVSMSIEALRRRFVAPLWARLVDRIAPPLERALNTLWDRLLALGRKILGDV